MGARLERYPRARASEAVDGATHASVTSIAIATRAFDRIARAWACGERTMGWGRFLDWNRRDEPASAAFGWLHWIDDFEGENSYKVNDRS